MRLLLLTGTGGAGTTTLAAATAVRAAREGVDTLLLAPRPPLHPGGGPAGVLGVRAAPAGEAVEVEPGLVLSQLGPRAVADRAWAALSAPLGGLLRVLGVPALDAAEFTPPPAVADVVALLAIRDAALCGCDLAVVDAGPLDAALGLVALPAAGARLVERVLPVERRMLWATGAGGLPGGLSGGPHGGSFVPGRGAVEAVERLHDELAAARDVLAAPSTAVRLVLPPEPAALAQAAAARTALALAGLAVHDVVVNRPPARGG